MHLTDGSLFALLDGELAPDLATAARIHLRECAACHSRAEELQRQRQEVAQLLAHLDGAPPAVSSDELMARAGQRVGRRRGLLAAGLATLLLGGAAVVFATPVPRQWLVRVFHIFGTSRPQGPSHPPAVPGRSGIALVPGPTLSLSFREIQSSGSIRISVVTDSLVTVRVLGDTVAYTVGAQAVAIGNDARATASYEIRLPRTLAHAQVRIGDRVVFVKSDSGMVSAVPPDSATGEYVIPFRLLQEHGWSLH